MKNICEACEGYGYNPKNYDEDCPECEGKGYTEWCFLSLGEDGLKLEFNDE
jgi:DnaJ-class molecular chaperone